MEIYCPEGFSYIILGSPENRSEEMGYNVPPWLKGHPPYVYVYWVAVFGALGYYGIQYIVTPAPQPEKLKGVSLSQLSTAQLEKLKQQRMEQLKNNTEKE